MGRFKRYLRTNRTLVEIIILLIGILLITMGNNISSNALKGIITGIGTSIFASSIVVFITDAFLGAEDSERIKQWGIEAVYSTRGEMNASCDLYLKKAKNCDIIAFGLRSLRDSQQNTLEKMLKKGGRIRIITMRPNCENLAIREQDEKQSEGSISHSIQQLIEWAQLMNSRKYKGCVEIKIHDRQPLEFLFMMDNRLYIGPYEYGKNSQQTISYEFNNTGEAYEYYKKYFEDLWNNKDFCQNALK